MIVQYRAKDINLSDVNKAHIEAAVEKFKRYSLDLTRVMCNVMAQKDGVSVEFEIHVAHAAPIIITEQDKDLDAAIDIAIDRASKALRRLHDKVKDHKGSSLKELDVIDA